MIYTSMYTLCSRSTIFFSRLYTTRRQTEVVVGISVVSSLALITLLRLRGSWVLGDIFPHKKFRAPYSAEATPAWRPLESACDNNALKTDISYNFKRGFFQKFCCLPGFSTGFRSTGIFYRVFSSTGIVYRVFFIQTHIIRSVTMVTHYSRHKPYYLLNTLLIEPTRHYRLCDVDSSSQLVL